MNRLKAVLADAHGHLGLWYSYLVGASVTLQASWSEMDSYIPPLLRHWVIGAATFIVVLDRIAKSVRATAP